MCSASQGVCFMEEMCVPSGNWRRWEARSVSISWKPWSGARQFLSVLTVLPSSTNAIKLIGNVGCMVQYKACVFHM